MQVHTVSSHHYTSYPNFPSSWSGSSLAVWKQNANATVLVSVVVFFPVFHLVKTLAFRLICLSKILLMLLRPCCPHFLTCHDDIKFCLSFSPQDPQTTTYGLDWSEIKVSLSFLKNAAIICLNFFTTACQPTKQKNKAENMKLEILPSGFILHPQVQCGKQLVSKRENSDELGNIYLQDQMQNLQLELHLYIYC